MYSYSPLINITHFQGYKDYFFAIGGHFSLLYFWTLCLIQLHVCHLFRPFLLLIVVVADWGTQTSGYSFLHYSVIVRHSSGSNAYMTLRSQCSTPPTCPNGQLLTGDQFNRLPYLWCSETI